MALTTGNSYTVVSGVEAATSAAKEVGLEMATATGAVVGAGGAIGKALAILLSEQVQNLILIGNPARPEKSEYRMLKVAVEIIQHLRTLPSGRQLAPGSLGAFAAQLDSVPAEDAPLSVWVEFAREVLASGAPLTLTVDSRAHLPRADLILAATSSLEALITPDVLKRGAVVCDMSRPSNVSKEVLEERPDVLGNRWRSDCPARQPDLGWNFGFEKGTAFACMSETMMLALEGRYEHMSIGADLSLEHLELMRGLAKKLGFTLAGFRAFDRPLDPAVWERVRALRKKETA